MKSTVLLLALLSAVAVALATVQQQWYECPFDRVTMVDRHPVLRSLLLNHASADLYPFILECTNVTVPLNWASPTPWNSTINLWVSRIRPPFPFTATKHEWMMIGGPGGAGEYYIQWADALPINIMEYLQNKVTLMLPDHRGTGLSSELQCLTNEPTKHCADRHLLKWGAQGLAQFNIENAARDMDYLMSVLSVPEVGEGHYSMYGASYGTLWLQRYLQLRKLTKPATVTLSGICSPDTSSFDQWDSNIDAVGQEILRRCASNTDCKKPFTDAGYGDPWSLLNSTLATINNQGGHQCLDQLGFANAKEESFALKNGLGMLVIQRVGRLLIPPLLFRLARCNNNDLQVLDAFFRMDSVNRKTVAKRIPIPDDASGLYKNIATTEMSTVPAGAVPPFAKLYALEDTLMMTQSNLAELVDNWNNWPHYAISDLWGKYPSMGLMDGIAVLFMNGDLDAQTALKWGEHSWSTLYSKLPKSYFMVVPNGVHAVLYNSPTSLPDGTHCALAAFRSFLLSDGNQLDQSCLKYLLPLDWMGTLPETKQQALQLIGTTDMWGL